MIITVVGSGYVGLVLAACLAEIGNDVTCVDCDEAKIRTLRSGSLPIFEPGLPDLVSRNQAAGRLTFTTELGDAVARSRVVFIAVGTPQGEDGSANLFYLFGASRDVARAINGYTVIVIKSTVPVGTGARVRELVSRETPHAVAVVSNPEFLKQGTAVQDFVKPDRIVIASDDTRAIALMKEVYAPIIRTGVPLLVTDPASAELGKYASNAMLAVRISFMNEIANVCEAWGADVEQVREILGADRRVGPSCLSAGLGFGGSCLPKDVRALRQCAAAKGYDFKILRVADEVNQLQRHRFLRKLEAHFGSLQERTIAIWGLAFKPDTDDIRDAPSVFLIDRLLRMGARVHAYDREAKAAAQRIFGDRIALADEPYDVLEDADALVIATDWEEFRRPDFARMRDRMCSPVIFDGRNMYKPERMQQLGFAYFSVGREAVAAPAPRATQRGNARLRLPGPRQSGTVSPTRATATVPGVLQRAALRPRNDGAATQRSRQPALSKG